MSAAGRSLWFRRSADDVGPKRQVKAEHGSAIDVLDRETPSHVGDDALAAYRYAVRERGLLYHDNGWRPQVTFVMLGANVFYGDVKAGERWPSLPLLAREWTEAFAQFVIRLHRQAPDDGPIIMRGIGTALRLAFSFHPR